jgi:hypothetical protein
MLESCIAVDASFPNAELAAEVETIIQALAEDGDTPFHVFIQRHGLARGMDFPAPSWWVPTSIHRYDHALSLTFVGSPSGYCPQQPQREDDLVIWLKRCGATTVGGRVEVDTGVHYYDMAI